MPKPTCSIEGCRKTVVARGWCGMHYRRWRVNGDPAITKLPNRGLSFSDTFRFYMPGEPPGDGVPWVWAGPTDNKGYGVVFSESTRTSAHRISYQLFNGPIPEGLVVRHKNDTPLDVNPHNLELGTQADNALDRDVRGRSGSAKLTATQVIKIRTLYSSGKYLQRELAEQFGISKTAISFATRGLSWKHVNGHSDSPPK